jgi:hypothetical protein
MPKTRWAVIGCLCALAVASSVHAANKVDIFVYTETVQWIAQGQAQGEADTFMAAVKGKPGIGEVVNLGMKDIEGWTKAHTQKNAGHMIVLYGDFPPTIYPDKNAKPDGSLAEEFLDAGNTFANSADYFFWGLNGRNEEGGLKNMMDIPAITMWGDNTPMKRTKEAEKIAPDVPKDFTTDRPFHVDELKGDWVMELGLGTLTGDQNTTRCDPCVIHNKATNGRLIQVFQTNSLRYPDGKVLAQIVLNFYLDRVGALAVDPQDKVSVAWGDLKRR